MPSISVIASVLTAAIFAQSALAVGVEPRGTIAPYARFCNDDNCSEGCGAWVAVDNPGCLTQYGRRSVFIKGNYRMFASLVASPGPTCDW